MTIAVIVRRTAPVAVITNPDASAVKFFRDQAEGSATDAAGSATTASTAATTATTQAGIATTAATTATTQAGIATTQAGIATTGAATATTQAGIATTGAATATTQATTAGAHATDSATSALAAQTALATFEGSFGWAANVTTGSTTNYTITTAGPGVLRLVSTGASPQTRLPIKATAIDGWMTFYVWVSAKSTGSPNQLTLYQTGGASSDLSAALKQDGTVQAVELQATLLSATHVRITNSGGGATGDNYIAIVPVPGRATDTNLSAALAEQHSSMRARVGKEIEWNGHVRAPATTNSVVTGATLASFNFNKTVALGSENFSIPLNSALAVSGEKLTFLYVACNGTGLAPSVIPKTNGGGNAASAPQSMVLDGQPHKMPFTLTADATQLSGTVSNQTSYFDLVYLIVPGAIDDAKLASLNALLLAMIEIFIQPTIDSNVRDFGVITGPSVNVSFDSHTPIGIYGFEAYKTNGSNGNTYWARFPTRTVANDEKYTLIYRVAPRTGEAKAIGTVKARWYNSGSKSNLEPLTADGMFHTAEFTTTGAASLFYVEVDNTSADFRFEGYLAEGHASDTTVSFGLSGFLLTLANVLNSSLANLIGERWVASQKQIMLGPVFGFEGRHVTFYTRQLLVARQRSRTIDVGLISQPDTKPYAYVGAPMAGYDVEEAIADFSAVARLPVDTLAARSYLTAQVLDSADTTHPLTRTVPFHAAAASGGSGSAMVVNLGDSYGAIYRPHIRELVNMTGFTWAGVGTIGSGADKNQAVSGYSTNDWMGRRTTDLTLAGNPFLRAADPAGADSDWQDVCFAIGGTAGSSARWPNYVEDATQAAYYIPDWDTWRQNGAVALAGTEKLTLLVTLWINDSGDGYTDWLTLLDQNYERIVTNFLETFPNGRVLIALPGVSGNGNNGNVNWAELSGAALAILNRFRDREAEQIYVLPTWAMMSCDLNQNTSTLSSTDTATGTETRTITDFVHARDFMQRQFAEPVAAAVCWLAETYGV